MMGRKKLTVKVRKTYAGSKMLTLTPQRRMSVYTASENGKSVRELCEELERKDGLKISQTSLGAWLAQMRAKYRLERTADAVREVIGAAKEMNGGEIDIALEALVKQKLFDFIAEDKSPESIAELFRCVLASRKQSVDERKVDLLEKKAAALDKIREAATSKDRKTSEERLAEIDRLLGL